MVKKFFKTFTMMERKSIVGLTLVLLFFIVSTAIIGKKNLWFEKKNYYHILLKEGDGIHVGSVVNLKGIRVGDVTKIGIDEQNRVALSFSVKRSFANKLTEGCVARIKRSFIIGEKSIDLLLSDEKGALLKNGAIMKSEEAVEILDLLSSSVVTDLATKLTAFSTNADKIITILNELLVKVDPKNVVATYELLLPTLKNLNQLLTSSSKTLKTVNEDLVDSKLLTKTLQNANKIMGPVAKEEETIARLMKTLNELSAEIAKSPQFSKQMVGAIDELTTTLKALQKTWMLSNQVEKVKAEQKTQVK